MAIEAEKQKPSLDRLTGAQTVMRPVEEADLSMLRAWDEDPLIDRLMGKMFVNMSPDEWFRSSAQDRSSRTWSIETKGGIRDGRLIGWVELAHVNWRSGTAELCICIGEKDCWNRGYGSDAIRTVLEYAFLTYRLQEVYLRVYQSNRRAIRVYERIGFFREAIMAPSRRRQDPAPVLLMKLPRDRYLCLQAAL